MFNDLSLIHRHLPCARAADSFCAAHVIITADHLNTFTPIVGCRDVNALKNKIDTSTFSPTQKPRFSLSPLNENK